MRVVTAGRRVNQSSACHNGSMQAGKVLYVSDLDGTLLDNDAELSARSRALLCDMLDKGLDFTVATARSFSSVAQILAGLPLRLPVIEFNGAFLSHMDTGHHEIVNSIEHDIADSLYDLIAEFGETAIISTHTASGDRVYYSEIPNDGMMWYVEDRLAKGDTRWIRLGQLQDALRNQVVCFTVVGRLESMVELESSLNAIHDRSIETYLFESMYSPGWHWLTVHDWRATKDRAVSSLRQRYGLLDHELVVFGDGANDIKMFKAADRAIAVSNASDDVKACASAIIGPNTSDSVANYIANEWARPV